tara:strand:- start:1137 stop:1418 length:282 start_codon:yes stop_codon:yes gene_type:complete
MADNKPLYKPFKSKKSGKKFSVYVKSKSGSGKGKRLIHFGATGYDDFRSGKATKEQRKSYLARAKGIKKKDGSLAWKDKNSPNYWAVKYLWGG